MAQIMKFVGADEDGETDVGAIILDDGELTSMVGPAGSVEVMDSVMSEPVFDVDEDVYPDDPERWFSLLPKMYRSAYFMALPSRELTDEDLRGYEAMI